MGAGSLAMAGCFDACDAGGRAVADRGCCAAFAARVRAAAARLLHGRPAGKGLDGLSDHMLRDIGLDPCARRHGRRSGAWPLKPPQD